MENIGSSIRGIYRDILKDRDNRVLYDSGWQSNKIVDGCRKLLAAFMKNDGPKGICSLKVGQGKQEWDNNQTPTPETSAAALEDPAPFKIDAADISKLKIAYLDEADVEVDGITSRIQVTATLGENEPPPGTGLSTYPLREFGLFGEYTDGSGAHEYMIDCIRHPVIHKDTSATLIRVVKLYF